MHRTAAYRGDTNITGRSGQPLPVFILADDLGTNKYRAGYFA